MSHDDSDGDGVVLGTTDDPGIHRGPHRAIVCASRPDMPCGYEDALGTVRARSADDEQDDGRGLTPTAIVMFAALALAIGWWDVLLAWAVEVLR